MTASELVAARVELGYSASECAETLGVPEAKIATWEAGQKRIPRSSVRIVEWLVAMKRRERAIEAAVPRCPWATERIDRPDPDDHAEFQRELDEWDAHVAACAACQARETFIETQLGPEPPWPKTVWGGALDAILALPEWAQAGVGGAAMAFAIVAFAGIELAFDVMFGQGGEFPASFSRGVFILVAFTAGGAVVGLAYGGVKTLLRR